MGTISSTIAVAASPMKIVGRKHHIAVDTD